MDLFVESDQVSCQDKQLILDEHNSLREKISFGEIQGMPSAANMRELVRDNFRSIFLIFKKKKFNSCRNKINDSFFRPGTMNLLTWHKIGQLNVLRSAILSDIFVSRFAIIILRIIIILEFDQYQSFRLVATIQNYFNFE